MRFYLVDCATEICYDHYIEGVKCVSMSEDVFNEHFPGYPIFPGTLILEGLAQLSGLFFEICLKRKNISHKRSVLTLINRMKYRRMVVPGDRLIYRSEIKSISNEYGVVKVTATCEGKLCADGELMFSFLEIMNEEMEKITDDIVRSALVNAKIIPSHEVNL